MFRREQRKSLLPFLILKQIRLIDTYCERFLTNSVSSTLLVTRLNRGPHLKGKVKFLKIKKI
jgi:hypothetical protein